MSKPTHYDLDKVERNLRALYDHDVSDDPVDECRRRNVDALVALTRFSMGEMNRGTGHDVVFLALVGMLVELIGNYVGQVPNDVKERVTNWFLAALADQFMNFYALDLSGRPSADVSPIIGGTA